MAIGVQPYTLRYRVYDAKQLEETYKKLSEMGYDGPEGGMGARFMSVDEDVALLKKYGLRVASCFGDLSKPDESMARAEKYGVKILGLPAIGGEMMHSPEGFKAYASQLNKMTEPFKGSGFRFQYHNHTQEFRNFPQLNGKSGMEILIDETAPELIMFELDTHWVAAAGGDPVWWINKVSGRIPIIHFKDYAIDWKAQDSNLGAVYKVFAEIGQGNINWPPIVEACKTAGVEWYIVEQDVTSRDEFECLKTSISFMKSIGVK